MKNFLFSCFVLFTISICAQSNKDKSNDLVMEAIEKMDSGSIDEAIEILKQCKKLDPDNINCPYETAYAYYLKEDYKTALKILKGLQGHPNISERVYQLLGNSYDLTGKPGKAIEIYEKGLTVFPKSGILYLERGNMEAMREAYNEALFYYEKGIEVDPAFPSNYYWASRIYLSSSEEVWGMIYGELFMNLERNSARTAEISKLLYDTYKSEISFKDDTTIAVSFSQNASISLGNIDKDASSLKLPFGIGAYEPTLIFSVVQESEINMDALDNIRTRFVDNYFKNGFNEKYPVVLFDFHNMLIEKGHFGSYNHWILMKGNEEEFDEWYRNNGDKWEEFMKWFQDNQLELDESNKFFSNQFN